MKDNCSQPPILMFSLVIKCPALRDLYSKLSHDLLTIYLEILLAFTTMSREIKLNQAAGFTPFPPTILPVRLLTSKIVFVTFLRLEDFNTMWNWTSYHKKSWPATIGLAICKCRYVVNPLGRPTQPFKNASHRVELPKYFSIVANFTKCLNTSC